MRAHTVPLTGEPRPLPPRLPRGLCAEHPCFTVLVKFVSFLVNLDLIAFQDLLQLQYEGVAVMKMFDKAKVNVNLLIFLINKKFYGK